MMDIAGRDMDLVAYLTGELIFFIYCVSPNRARH
jgi:hypothetical protein